MRRSWMTNRDDRRGGFLRLERGRQAFRCEHRQRGALGDALQDHGQISSSPSGAIAGPAVSRRSSTICSA